MIYILEGIHGGGKSTYAETLGLPIKHKWSHTIGEIKNELNDKDNIVYDRLFCLEFMNHSDEEILELNEYLKSLTNVKCLMFICERELGWQRESLKQNKFMTREKYDASYDGIQRLISKMDVFEVIDTTN